MGEVGIFIDIVSIPYAYDIENKAMSMVTPAIGPSTIGLINHQMLLSFLSTIGLILLVSWPTLNLVPLR